MIERYQNLSPFVANLNTYTVTLYNRTNRTTYTEVVHSTSADYATSHALRNARRLNRRGEYEVESVRQK